MNVHDDFLVNKIDSVYKTENYNNNHNNYSNNKKKDTKNTSFKDILNEAISKEK